MSSQFFAYSAPVIAATVMAATALFTRFRMQRRQERLRQASVRQAASKQSSSRPTLIVDDNMMSQLKGSGVYVMSLADATTIQVTPDPFARQLTDEERAALRTVTS